MIGTTYSTPVCKLLQTPCHANAAGYLVVRSADNHRTAVSLAEKRRRRRVPATPKKTDGPLTTPASN